jgi:hypothetical protein
MIPFNFAKTAPTRGFLSNQASLVADLALFSNPWRGVLESYYCLSIGNAIKQDFISQ